MPRRSHRVDPASLAAELSQLGELDGVGLRNRWRALYGSEPPPRISRDLIIRAVAYRLQEAAQGGLRPALRRRLQHLAVETKLTGSVVAEPRLKPGTRLIREWHGTVHEVTVLESSFEWQGRQCRSLSEIARAITGTRWSGPLFFGLKSPRHPDRSISGGR